MGTGFSWLVGAACIAAFGVCLRFAIQMLLDRKYRDSAAWFFWSFLPLLIVCFILAAKGDPTMSEPIRNLILGFVGAVMGASAAIWIGYAVFDGSAIAQQSQSSQPSTISPPVTINGGDNVVSIG
jgi:drug/metabolite transporter (DMT)-like permease